MQATACELQDGNRFVNVLGIGPDVGSYGATYSLDGVSSVALGVIANRDSVKHAYRERCHNSWTTFSISRKPCPIVFLNSFNRTLFGNKDYADGRWLAILESSDLNIAGDKSSTGSIGAFGLCSDGRLIFRRQRCDNFVSKLSDGGCVDPIEDFPKIEIGMRIGNRSGSGNHYSSKLPNLADAIEGFFPLVVGEGQSSVSANVNRIGSQGDNDDTSSTGKNGQQYESTNPLYLRYNSSPFGMTVSRLGNSKVIFHLTDQDVDISWDMKHWFHLAGEKCFLGLPPIKLKVPRLTRRDQLNLPPSQE